MLIQQQIVLNQISTNNPNDASAIKGPFVLVFGERNDECEQTWMQRADNTFSALQAFLTSLNANPNELMPEDAFLNISTNDDDVQTMIGGNDFDAVANTVDNTYNDAAAWSF